MKGIHVNNLAHALSAHRVEGRHSVGTAAIVESLHTDFHQSYEQIADTANVSLAGLRRWRERDVGDRTMFEPLLKYAQKLVGGELPEPDPDRPEFPAPDARQVQPLTIAEAKQGLSLKFGVDPSMIEIVIKG